MIAYDEQEGMAFQQDVIAAYAKAGRQTDLNNVVWSNRMTYDAAMMGYPASRAKHLAELNAALGLMPPHPSQPTRDQLLAVRVGFQGETVTTTQYGSFPAFGPETTTLSDEDLRSYCAQLATRGWTHGEIAISWQYDEPGFLMPVPGRDLTNDLPELVRRVGIMCDYFTGVLVFLAGDGRSAPKNPDGSYPYNDPVGHTYGCEWLMEHLHRILDAFRPHDLYKRVVFLPGYDGVFYGWGNTGEPDLQPQRVVDFGRLFRALLPDGYLGIEHTPGNIPVGEGGSDWAAGGRMQVYDLILSEFFWPVTGDQVWQVIGRLNRPYHRPPDQPAGDDPNPPFYLAATTPRGPVSYVPYEYATYQWTRGQVSAADVQSARDYFHAMGCVNVC